MGLFTSHPHGFTATQKITGLVLGCAALVGAYHLAKAAFTYSPVKQKTEKAALPVKPKNPSDTVRLMLPAGSEILVVSPDKKDTFHMRHVEIIAAQAPQP